MFLLFGAFVAGMITVLAPCVLPLLPVVIGGSITTGHNKSGRLRPLVIATSLAVSLAAFTLLLKASTLLIHVPPQAYPYISGGILVGLGIVMLFPAIYDAAIIKFNVQRRTASLIGTGLKRRQNIVGPMITGAALGPVFSSCSPVYAYILASVLPVDFARAMSYMLAYILGLCVILLLIGLLGQRFVRSIKWASNPHGWFQRVIAIIFILVGVLIITGNTVRLQTWVSVHTPFNLDSITSRLLPKTNPVPAQNGVLNVKPYRAPALAGLTNWTNGPPLTLQQLRGKVVLVDFWTYSCINCIRSLPYLENWYQTYQAEGLVVLGIHAPEFSFERNPANVRTAVTKDDITYPVALDNDYATWNAFHNQYWPADYLIDKQGNVRRVYAGEGQYKETEQAIRDLLQEGGGPVTAKHASMTSDDVPITTEQTPETYVGVDKQSSYAGDQAYTFGQQSFTPAAALGDSQWTLGGTWNLGAENITAGKGAMLTLKASARDVYLVAGSSSSATANISVRLNGKPVSETGAAGQDVHNSQVAIGMPQLYRLVHQPSFTSEMLITLTVPPGVQLNAFTFGS